MADTTYTIKTGDILLCDINSSITAGVLTIPNVTNTAVGGLCFNFAPGASVTKQLDKTIYVIRKPGVPTMYEIGLGERLFNITTTIKKPYSAYSTGIFQRLSHLNWLCNDQYTKTITSTGKKSYGILNFYYVGDEVQTPFYLVGVKSLCYEQRPGSGKIFDIRIGLTQVEIPG